MTFEQIGQKLKIARETQGLTLNQIWERTKIPMHHLQSMESGVTDELPETVYVAGFIKRYADVVGLNGQALSDEYRREAVPEKGSNGNGHFPRPSRASAQSVVVVPAPYMGKTRMESGAPSLIKTMVFPSLLALMLIGLIAVLLYWHSNSAINQPDESILNLGAATNKFNQVQPTAPNVPPPATSPAQQAATTTATPPASQQVEVTASKHVWVDVKSVSTNESLFTGFLEAGDRRDFKDAQGIRISAGSGGSVNVAMNGKSQILGPPGKPTEKEFMVAGIPAATPATGADASATAGPGSTLGAPATTKPVKKPAKKTSGTDSASGGHHRYRSIDEAPSRQYMPGESLGGSRSIDVPYRYTEGRLDTEN